LPFDACAFPPFDDFRALAPELREAELRPRDDADDVRRLDALPLFVPLRDAVVFRDELVLRAAVDPLPLRLFVLLLLLFELPLLVLAALRLLGLDPFELRELACRLFVERVLPWAIAPP
jgi:hypothetical protein